VKYLPSNTSLKKQGKCLAVQLPPLVLLLLALLLPVLPLAHALLLLLWPVLVLALPLVQLLAHPLVPPDPTCPAYRPAQ
jgi:hypothetical protein